MLDAQPIETTATEARFKLRGLRWWIIGLIFLFVCSIMLWSIAAMAHAFARGLISLSILRFVLGLGEAGNWPGAAKTVAEWFPIRERAFGMAIFNSGAAIGSVVAPPLIVWLSLAYGWQTTFIVTGSLPKYLIKRVPLKPSRRSPAS